MPFMCSICEKALPTRTGIWNHLKNKHPEISENSNVGGDHIQKRKKLDKYIVCKDSVKPVQSQPGRPVDDTIELSKKIKLKSEASQEDISLKTLMNPYAQKVLNSIAMIEERDPGSEYRPELLLINEKMNDQQQKLFRFLNRMKVLFNKDMNSKIDELAKNFEVISEKEQTIADPFLLVIVQQAVEYSQRKF